MVRRTFLNKMVLGLQAALTWNLLAACSFPKTSGGAGDQSGQKETGLRAAEQYENRCQRYPAKTGQGIDYRLPPDDPVQGECP